MPEPHKQRSIEYYGVGQSGYTAGRIEGDPALEKEIQDRNFGYPKDAEECPDFGDDDRFTGRGHRRWVAEESESWPPKADIDAADEE